MNTTKINNFIDDPQDHLTKSKTSGCKIGLLITSIVFCLSTASILMIVTVKDVQSIYFLLIDLILENLLLYIILFLIVKVYRLKILEEDIKTEQTSLTRQLIIYSGIACIIGHIFLTYSSSPSRTPIIIQTVFTGSSIIPGVILSNIFLNKRNEYNKYYIITSLLFLLVTIGLSIYPLIKDFYWTNIGWVCLHLFGILSTCFYSVFNEKYFSLINKSYKLPTNLAKIIEEKSKTMINTLYIKLEFMMYQTGVQMFILLLCFWLDIFLAYSSSPWTDFKDSLNLFFTGGSLTLSLQFIVLMFNIAMLLMTYLNAISAKYCMISKLLNSPVILIFFLIFPHLNNGVDYPTYIVVICLFTSIISVSLWIKGDKIIENVT